jgi:hypothetical protein
MKIFVVDIKIILTFILIARSLVCMSQSENYQDTTLVIEKVYLHTDRDYYLPGDTLWFKAYLIDASEMLLSDHSRNLHVEIISPEAIITDSRIVRITNGLGNGDFILSENLKSGAYYLRAYTNYMRNFGGQLFFTREIRIAGNPDSAVMVSYSVRPGSNTLHLQFFPEGGSLVDDVTSVVGFKVTDGQGYGCDITGVVYCGPGDSVTTFKSNHNGMGKFTLRPLKGREYYAVVKDSNGNSVKKDLPQSFVTGAVLNVTDTQNDDPLVVICTNSLTLPDLLGRKLVLTVSVRNKILKSLSFEINSLFNSLKLPLEDLPYGVLQLTLSGPDQTLLCERLIYHDVEEAYLEIVPGKQVYNKRSPVSAVLSLKGNSLLYDQAFISLSVAESVYLNSDSRSNSTISSWFLLESDIRGDVEDPSYYFNLENTDRLEALDLLLCTQGWRDFAWKYHDTLYKPENGFFISGRVEKLLSHKPLENSMITALLISDDGEQLLKIPADSTGTFCFEELDINREVRIIASVTGEDEKFRGNLMLDNPEYFPEKVNKDGLIRKSMGRYSVMEEDNLRVIGHDYKIKSSILNQYKLSDTILLGEVEIISRKNKQPPINYAIQSSTSGFPDNIIEMTPQLETRNDIRSILRIRVAGLTFVDTGDPEISGIRIRGSGLEPLFMLDGIEVPYGVVASVPLTWIERIEVLKGGGIATTMMREKSEDGQLKHNGVISVVTKPPEERKVYEKPVFHSINTIIKGYDVQRIFYSPDYTGKLNSDNKPDLRSTLFWEPDISVEYGEEYNLIYFNADKTGKITITAEGMTVFGIPVTGKADYEIK